MFNHSTIEGTWRARLLRTGPWAIGPAVLALACGPAEDGTSGEIATKTEEALHTVAGATWSAQGPAPIEFGRSRTFPLEARDPVTGGGHAVAVHPTNPNIVYFGGINGGVWRTNDALATSPTWTPLTDAQPSQNIGALALDRGNPNVVIAGTGRWSSMGNEGGSEGELLRSSNGGSTWTLITNPLFAGQKISGVVSRGNTLLVANVSSSTGLARSTNGGSTWTRISGAAGSGLPLGTIDDLIEDRQNANRLYLTMSGIGVFRSNNLGATWVNISRNDPGSGGLDETIRLSSIGAKMSTSNDGRAYVGIVVPGDRVGFIGYTADGGNTWTRMTNLPSIEARGISFFHFTIAADPVSSNIVYVSGVNNWRRGDTNAPVGSQWTHYAFSGPNFTFPHVDVRDVAFDANNDLIEVSDGGIFRRPTPQVSADYISMAGNLQTVEMHALAYDQNSRILFGGTQDNGSIVQNAPGQPTWSMLGLASADGGDVQVDVASMPGFSIRYNSIQNLESFIRSTYDAANVQVAFDFPSLIGGVVPQFYTPIELNRVNPMRIVIAGGDAVHESFDQADNVISLGAGGGARTMFYGHPQNPDVLWAVSNVIFVRLTANGPLVPTPTPIPTEDARDVVLDPADFRRAYVAGGFSGVWLTPDAGVTWTDVTGNLASFDVRAVRSVEFIPGLSHGLVVVGTDRGVFVAASNALGTWQELGNLPNAPAMELQYNPAHDLLAVTLLGRGVWTMTGLGADNRPPVAQCNDVAADASSACTAAVSSAEVNNGSFDPEGGSVNCVLSPVGPFAVGTTVATLLCTDSAGATASCIANIHVGPGDTPSCCPAGTHVIVGTPNDDTINGTDGDDCILGLGGQDTINGLSGNDVISGGDGDDVISGGFLDDRIFGGPGQDLLFGNLGADIIAGGDGDDRCFGGDGVNPLSDPFGDDQLLGGPGQDRLFGEARNDRITGNAGDDWLDGGDDNDVLNGSGQHDVCIGGPASDSFLMCQNQTQ